MLDIFKTINMVASYNVPKLAMFCERLSAINIGCLILSLTHTHTHTHTHIPRTVIHKNTTERKFVNITRRVPVFTSKNQHGCKCDTDFMQQFNKQEVNIKRLFFRHHIACFCSISQTKIIPNSYSTV